METRETLDSNITYGTHQLHSQEIDENQSPFPLLFPKKVPQKSDGLLAFCVRDERWDQVNKTAQLWISFH